MDTDRPFSEQDAAVIQQYEGWSGVYDLFWRRYMQKTLPVLQTVAGVTAGDRVLDLACGTGELERHMVQETPGAEVVGVDLAESMVERSRQKLSGTPGVRFERADAHDLPFSADAFDAVVCASTFHYFTRPAVVLREVTRVLRPSGRFVVLDWCRDFWTCRAMDAVLHRIDPAYQGCYTLDEMNVLLQSVSLEVRHRFRYRFDCVWGMMIVRAAPQC